MSDIVRQTLPARRGKAVPVNAGESIRIINTHGTQVVDFWAYVAGHMNEFIGVEQCRATWTRLYPKTGDALYSNRRRAIMTLVEDTSPGRHDTLMAPCDNERYGLLGCTTYHDNCKDNHHAGLLGLGLSVPFTPGSINLFMNIPWDEEGNLEFAPALSKPGDYVTIRAEVDCIAVMSACPQDILKINSQKPVEARYEILSA
ncbi:MAG: urea carboxylase-associated family protein [Rhodobiaceae bacterium]|nr:urea carboxylase-associated family protein [Rhodobiaceae bacterium]MCC0050379.1 urea carboxylase-associated family protein [Rhodobiaceae bacterium]MCC0061118.1 urea carboxylase-associated family protein [Rhodobiaceae bacterium]